MPRTARGPLELSVLDTEGRAVYVGAIEGIRVARSSCPRSISPGFRVARRAGVYNVVDVNDTTNLELREDGTFRRITHGCDYEGSSSGLWSMDGDVIVLTAAGEGEQHWREGVCPTACVGWSYIGPEGERLTAAVEEIRLEPQPDGSWAAHVLCARTLAQ